MWHKKNTENPTNPINLNTVVFSVMDCILSISQLNGNSILYDIPTHKRVNKTTPASWVRLSFNFNGLIRSDYIVFCTINTCTEYYQ